MVTTLEYYLSRKINKIAINYFRWGYRRSETTDSCTVDETLGYKAILAENTHRTTAPPEGSLLDFNLQPRRRNVPWTTRAVYNLNYYSAVILNHTLHFYNLAGFESWVQSWSSACSNSAEPAYLLLTLSAFIHVLQL